jgi:large subunit ribosomal protein L4
MPKVNLYNQAGTELGQVELADSVFGIEPNEAVLFDAVIMQRASLRQGTHKVKTRSEVRGGGAKPYRQKGTGRARQGTIRAPHYVGGGTVFGPTPRKYGFKLNRKVRRLALKSAFSQKVVENNIVVLDKIELQEMKTKEMVAILNNLKVEGKVVIVANENVEGVARAARNLKNTFVVDSKGISVLDLMHYDTLVITQEAAKSVEEALQ